MTRSTATDRVQIALFTPGYPYVDAALRAAELARRDGATLSRSIGEPASVHRDQFARWFVDTDATHALLLEGDVVPPADALERMLAVDAPVVTAAYPQWVDDRLSTNVQALSDPTWSDVIPARVFPIRRCLLGCVLVRRDVFAALQAPLFLSTMAADRFMSDDEWFCRAVRGARMSILCDGTVMCRSLRQGTDLLALAGAHVHRSE